MAKVCLITDTHAGVRNDSLVMLDYQKKFYDKIFFPYLDTHKIDRVIHLGDVFDRRKYVNYQTLKMTREMFFEPLRERGISMEIILGNHDSHFRNTLDVNSPNLLLKDYGFRIYDLPEYVDVEGVNCLFVPWMTPENSEMAHKMIDETKAQIIMGHLEIAGYEFMRGRACEHGLSSDIFANYLAVFSGHFHYKSQSNGIMYLGTPYEMTWADFNVAKGFHILDTDKLSIDFIENPFKLFHKIVYDDTIPMPEIDSEKLTGAYIKVIISKKTNPAFFESYMDKLNRCNASSIIVVDEPVFRPEGANTAGTFKIEDTLTFMTNYIQNFDISGNKDKVVTLIQDLYHQANELEI